MLRAVLYLRLSVDRDGTRESIDIQEKDCRRLCAERGWEVVAVQTDRDVSGYKKVKTPGFDAALGMLSAREAEVLVFWKVDRLTRRGIVRIGEILKVLEETGGRIVSYNEQLDTSTAMGEGILGFLASQAKQESQNQSLRIRAHEDFAARRGELHAGGYRCYGYNRDGTLETIEAQLLRGIAARVIEGASLHSQAAELNTRGVKTSGGTEWSSSQIGRTLRSPRLRGVRVHLGEQYPGDWEPVFTEDVHLAVLAALDGRGTGYPTAANHLLTGLVWCGTCGNRMSYGTLSQNQKIFPMYRCVKRPGQKQCGHVSASERSVDDIVSSDTLAHLVEVDLPEATDDAPRLQALLDGDRASLAELARARYFERSLTADMFEAARKPLGQRVAETERALSVAIGHKDSAVIRWADAVAGWENVTERRRIIGRVVERVVIKAAVKRGRIFDRDRVKITWR